MYHEGVEMLVLGTAQLGMEYGVANRTGTPDESRVAEILDQAYISGIRILDTAAAYGESENALGRAGISRWEVITKVPSFSELPDDRLDESVYESVLRSLDRLKTDCLFAVLAHDHRDMVGERGRRVLGALERLQAENRVQSIGVSVYTPSDLDGLEPAATQIVQAPFNVLDQRIVGSDLSAELHVRSVFLQGLLLMPPHARPARFARWNGLLIRFDERIRDSGLDPVAFCLGFAAQQPAVAKCVVGLEHPDQLAGIVAAFGAGRNVVIEAEDMASYDLDLIDPRRWKDEL
tara:strand:+ start:144 stop:1016 length:873 start_codon:yes stop_codon:yes gene_type:complete